MYDLAVIGGGVNGCGIARDAAGRGAKVLLLERGDLACGTSSASTKLIHGGLRYLEHYEFALVREALQERERLWETRPIPINKTEKQNSELQVLKGNTDVRLRFKTKNTHTQNKFTNIY